MMHPDFQRGLDLLGREQYPEALAAFELLIAQWPAAGEAHHFRAVALFRLSRIEEAVKSWDKAISLQPAQADYYSMRGVAFFHLGQKMAALEDMHQALLLEPHNPYRHSSRAYMRAALGDTGGAIEDYRQAIVLDPEDAIAHNNLGLLEEKAGRQERARELFDRADQLAGVKSPAERAAETPSANSQAIHQTPAEPQIEAPKVGYWDILKGIFTRKDLFEEFVYFVRSGGKLKS